MSKQYNIILFIGLTVICLLAFTADLWLGSVIFDIDTIWEALIIGPGNHSAANTILYSFRLPKATTALLCGASLGVAGLLMQTLFHNPLAGPYVLGISSGSSLGVAVLLMSSGLGILPSAYFLSAWGIVIAAIIGAMFVLFLVMMSSIRLKDTVSLLIIGIMLGGIVSSVVSILQSFSNPDALKSFVVWTMGSLGAVTWDFMYIMAPILLLGLSIAFLLQKPLNALLLGENYAKGLGVSIFWSRSLIILATCILAGAATAFAGPIAFIGVAVPHIVRGIFKTSDHSIVLPGCIITGATLLLLCDIVAEVPGMDYKLPINAISALIGAPIIIWVIFKNKQVQG